MSTASVTVLFASAMCGSAVLLFLVQPMFAKMVLPLLGGTPAVWNTCVLFFQTALLLGYAYAHALTRSFGLRTQAMLHVGLLLAPAAVLPIAIRGGVPPGGETPISWLLAVLAVSAGLPFFVVATTAPLLQRWFSALPHPAARDPYFLYAASNAGSMAGLLGYPFVVERSWRLADQSALWAFGYAAIAFLVAACALVAARFGSVERSTPIAPPTTVPASSRVRARFWWLVLAFVPSSLMLGVTTHISTDIAAVPLLWVVPLALYLLTFILAFAGRRFLSLEWTARLLPFLIVAVMASVLFGLSTWALILLHLIAFFAAALACHSLLAERRPDVRELTSFYLWISIGGALGGAFNTLVAPFAFVTIAEYPLALALVGFLRPSPSWRRGALEPLRVVVGLPCIALAVLLLAWLAGALGGIALSAMLVTFCLGTAMALAGANRLAPFGVAMLATAILSAFPAGRSGERVVLAARSFFGIHQVLEDVPPRRHRLRHGSTLHGQQDLTALDRCEPTTYFHPSGPIGQVFDALGPRARDVGVIGLGSGSLACYAQAGSRWTFYEIDAVVERIARDPAYFTFLKNSNAKLRVVLGDGRLTLAAATPASLDVVVVDAFSSDAIPMHLLTGEFLTLAMDRLRPDGVLALHVSNRYLDLEPVVAASAKGLGLDALMQRDRSLSTDLVAAGKTASNWMVLARPTSAWLPLVATVRWQGANAGTARGWTDDFSNLFGAVAWAQPAEAASR